MMTLYYNEISNLSELMYIELITVLNLNILDIFNMYFIRSIDGLQTSKKNSSHDILMVFSCDL